MLMMRKGAAILICVAAAWLVGPVAAKPTSECLMGLRDSLTRGGFSGPLICSKDDATFVLVGRTNKSNYSIYDYRYRFRPKDGNVMHGGQKIVVFRGLRYIGQYSLSPPPYNSISVCGSNVIVKAQDRRNIYSLDFSDIPPNTAFVDGEDITFYQ
jgi:hypothetical protein